MLQRMIVIMGKIAIGSVILILLIDLFSVIIDRFLIETRMWTLRNDIEEVAEENNGIPYVYIEEFNERLESIQDRSFLISDVSHNMQSRITINGELYDTVGTYDDSPLSDVRYYEYGEYMDIFIIIHFEYSTFASTLLRLWDEGDSSDFTMTSLGEEGDTASVNNKKAYWSRIMATEDQR